MHICVLDSALHQWTQIRSITLQNIEYNILIVNSKSQPSFRSNYWDNYWKLRKLLSRLYLRSFLQEHLSDIQRKIFILFERSLSFSLKRR